MNIGITYRNARNALGLSKAELSRRTGLSQPTIRNIETSSASLRSANTIMPILQLRWAWQFPDDHLPLGQSLAAIRRDQSISQRKMASYIGVSLPTVQALEQSFTGACQTLDRYTAVLGLVSPLVDDAALVAPKSRPLIPQGNDAASDMVFTPNELAANVIHHFKAEMNGVVLDPCRGDGAFFGQFPKHLDRRWCEITQGRDFMKWQSPVDWLITNPPWSKFRPFLNHSMSISDNIVLLCALTHFTTKARVSDIHNAGFGMKTVLYVPTPVNWPPSGFQMAAVHIRRNWGGPCVMTRLNQLCLSDAPAQTIL